MGVSSDTVLVSAKSHSTDNFINFFFRHLYSGKQTLTLFRLLVFVSESGSSMLRSYFLPANIGIKSLHGMNTLAYLAAILE